MSESHGDEDQFNALELAEIERISEQVLDRWFYDPERFRVMFADAGGANWLHVHGLVTGQYRQTMIEQMSKSMWQLFQDYYREEALDKAQDEFMQNKFN